MKTLKMILASMLLISILTPTVASARGWYGPGHSSYYHGGYRVHFAPEAWHGGYWHHGVYGGRAGWWWVVGGSWFFYNGPVYPYPVYYPAP